MRNSAAEPVLHWINECRGEQGLPPLTDLRPGARMATHFCPVARSLSEARRFGVTRVMASAPGYVFYLPDHVRKWTRDFDKGNYPEYVS